MSQFQKKSITILLENCRQYQVMISDYLACNCVDFYVSLNWQGPWVQCKHLYYTLQYAMYFGIKKPFIHYPLWSWNGVHNLLVRAIIMWISYLCFIVWLNLTYTSYCFTLLHCNVTLLNFTFDTIFQEWNFTWKLCESSNFHSS